MREPKYYIKINSKIAKTHNLADSQYIQYTLVEWISLKDILIIAI